jgi:hypothetical protein
VIMFNFVAVVILWWGTQQEIWDPVYWWNVTCSINVMISKKRIQSRVLSNIATNSLKQNKKKKNPTKSSSRQHFLTLTLTLTRLHYFQSVCNCFVLMCLVFV